jgi:microcystin-dependent protein
MGQPFVGEIRIFAGNFPPVGWMFCEGTPLPISENEVLFQLIGTTYGGDGEETFNLPDLRGRLPVHQGTNSGTGTNYQIGEMAGVEEVTLTTNQIPIHTHAFLATGDSGSAASPANATPGSGTSITIFRPTPPPPALAMAAQAIGPTGGSQPHTNLQPYLCMNYIISLFGIFPSQN